MTHYLNIHLLPDPELPSHVLMAALFNKAHHALTGMNATAIGITFPEYRKDPAWLGTQFRMVGSINALQIMLERPWLGALRDYVRIGAIIQIPENVEHRNLRRVQVKSSAARLRRRQMKRHDLNETDALLQIPDGVTEQLNLPYIQMRSGSSGQSFRLFLDLSEPQTSVNQGAFNTYGLSTTLTIPWF